MSLRAPSMTSEPIGTFVLSLEGDAPPTAATPMLRAVLHGLRGRHGRLGGRARARAGLSAHWPTTDSPKRHIRSYHRELFARSERSPVRCRKEFRLTYTRPSFREIRARRQLLALLAAPLVIPTASMAATDYPNRPVRIIVAGAPGGGDDFAARVLAEHLSAQLGQPFVVACRIHAQLPRHRRQAPRSKLGQHDQQCTFGTEFVSSHHCVAPPPRAPRR